MNRTATYVALAASLILAGPLPAASNGYPPTPKGVMEKYLRLDAEAAGLSASTWPELGQYTTWPQALAWDTFVVIDRYQIGKVIQGHTRAQVRVTYQPLGQLSDQFVPGTQPEAVVFYLNKVNGRWKVDGPALMPHVAFEVMKRRLEAKSTSDPKVKKANDDLLRKIVVARESLK